MTSDEIQALSAVAAAASAMFAALTTLQARKQIGQADRSAAAGAFLEINQEWNRIYPQYRTLLNMPFDCAVVLRANPDFNIYAGSQEWQEMRSVFAFYEFLGACVRLGVLREHTLFSLVSVNPALWNKFRPMIEAYREQGRQDLYTAWEYLVERRMLYSAGEEHLPLPNLWARWRRRFLR